MNIDKIWRPNIKSTDEHNWNAETVWNSMRSYYELKAIWLRCDGSQMNICHAVGYGVKKNEPNILFFDDKR